jgi:hypothetical protein
MRLRAVPLARTPLLGSGLLAPRELLWVSLACLTLQVSHVQVQRCRDGPRGIPVCRRVEGLVPTLGDRRDAATTALHLEVVLALSKVSCTPVTTFTQAPSQPTVSPDIMGHRSRDERSYPSFIPPAGAPWSTVRTHRGTAAPSSSDHSTFIHTPASRACPPPSSQSQRPT